MANKRKLNRRQLRRTKKVQDERSERALQKQRDLSRQQQSGELSSEQQGLVICRYNQHFEVEALEGDSVGEIHRCVTRANIDSLVAGDKVVWRAGAQSTGVIESRHPRNSLLERPDNFGKLKPVAANIDQMVIVIACEPAPQTNLIDRYLVAAELINVKPVIVLNKADLINDSNRQQIEALLSIYQDIGYKTIQIVSSRHQTPQLANLPELIKQHTSIVVGQSGVGKSSLINTLLPEAKLEIGALSKQTREGTHTTTRATLFHLPDGGELIDSPGIRDFSLWHIDQQQLQYGFVELAKLIGECRFRDCQHENEPGCVVRDADLNGKIHKERFANYQQIKAAITEQQARGLTINN